MLHTLLWLRLLSMQGLEFLVAVELLVLLPIKKIVQIKKNYSRRKLSRWSDILSKKRKTSLSGGSSHVLVKVIFIPFEESILSSSTLWVWQMSNWASILSLSFSNGPGYFRLWPSQTSCFLTSSWRKRSTIHYSTWGAISTLQNLYYIQRKKLSLNNNSGIKFTSPCKSLLTISFTNLFIFLFSRCLLICVLQVLESDW